VGKKKTMRTKAGVEVKPGEAYVRGYGAEWHSRGWEGLPEQARVQRRKVGATLRPKRPTDFAGRIRQGWGLATNEELASASPETIRAVRRGARPMAPPAGTQFAPDVEATAYGAGMTPRERASLGIKPDQAVPLTALQALRKWRRTSIAADRTGKVQRYTVEGEAFPRQVHPTTALDKLKAHVARPGAAPRERPVSAKDPDERAKKLIALGKDKEAIDELATRSKDRGVAKTTYRRLKAAMDKDPKASPVDPRLKLKYTASAKRTAALRSDRRHLQKELDWAYRDYAAAENDAAKDAATKAAQAAERALEKIDAELPAAEQAEADDLARAVGEEKQVAQDKKVDELIEAGPAGMSEEDIQAKHGPEQQVGGLAEQTPEAQAHQRKMGTTQPTASMLTGGATDAIDQTISAPAGTHPDTAVTLQAIQSELANQGYTDVSEEFLEAVGAVINGYQAALKGILREMKPKDYKLFVQWCAETGVDI
jgi:hypothetical protein